jgi:hypothetical protein
VARFLDVANARVEVRATGLTPSRHLLTCNGRRVPLRPTGTVGEAVAGIRFKACCPAATLHPTTPAVGALVVDLVDGWTGQAIGGFQFFPAAGTPAGPVAALSPLDDGVPGHGGRPLPAPSPLVGARPQSGRFVPAGSGRVPVDALPEEPVTGYVLDLT